MAVSFLTLIHRSFSSFFFSFAVTPSEANSNLLVKHGFDQTYQKSKKVKEGLSSFLPHLPGKASYCIIQLYVQMYHLLFRVILNQNLANLKWHITENTPTYLPFAYR